jgi:hypothetical protein
VFAFSRRKTGKFISRGLIRFHLCAGSRCVKTNFQTDVIARIPNCPDKKNNILLRKCSLCWPGSSLEKHLNFHSWANTSLEALFSPSLAAANAK